MIQNGLYDKDGLCDWEHKVMIKNSPNFYRNDEKVYYLEKNQ